MPTGEETPEEDSRRTCPPRSAEVAIPDVSGMRNRKSWEILTRAGLTPVFQAVGESEHGHDYVVQPVCAKNVPGGTVVSQTPPAGGGANAETRIVCRYEDKEHALGWGAISIMLIVVLLVAGGVWVTVPDVQKMPDVTGETVPQTQTELKTARLVKGVTVP